MFCVWVFVFLLDGTEHHQWQTADIQGFVLHSRRWTDSGHLHKNRTHTENKPCKMHTLHSRWKAMWNLIVFIGKRMLWSLFAEVEWSTVKSIWQIRKKRQHSLFGVHCIMNIVHQFINSCCTVVLNSKKHSSHLSLKLLTEWSTPFNKTDF